MVAGKCGMHREIRQRSTKLSGLRTSAGDGLMNIPRCKIHGCEMSPHRERVPFCGMGQGEAGPGRGHRRPMRITWECPRGDCHWVAIGQAEYEPTYEQIRREGWLTEL